MSRIWSQTSDAELCQAPFDATSLEYFADWRDAMHWPVAVSDIQRFQRAWMSDLADIIAAQDTDTANLLLLAFPFIITQCTVIAETGLALNGARERNLELVGGPSQLDALKTGAEAELPVLPGRPSARRALAKRLLLPATWSSLAGLPRALLHPSVSVISRNQLLKQEAQYVDAGVGYVDPGALLQHMNAGTLSPAEDSPLADIADVLARRMVACCELDADIKENCQAAAEFLASHILRHVWRDRAAVRSLNLPRAVWAGTGGQYHVRLIALEILQRGGTVSLFDHGGTAAMRAEEDSTALAIRELAVSTHYVLPTQALMEVAECDQAERWAHRFGFAGLRGGHGEVHLLKLPLVAESTPKERPRVLCPSSPIRGFRSTGVIPMPDIVYLDWQVRLAEMLAAMPIDLICKPHPEGAFSGRRHPVQDVAPVRSERFESLIGWTDVFVFDRCSSTTFWQAVCTDRPIIYIDTGVFQFGRGIDEMLRQRCQILKATYDERNRVVLDAAELRDAILSARGPVDAGPFRNLLIGEEALDGPGPTSPPK